MAKVADDRDHRGFKMPDNDNADYGWGKNSFRPVYFADGTPQGLNKWKSKSTGVANITGRSAAFAAASHFWKNDLKNSMLFAQYLQAAVELYEMGKRQEGYQQGNSFGAPYRYNEDIWADDMVWAAAELFKATGTRLSDGRQTLRENYRRSLVDAARDGGTLSILSFNQCLTFSFISFG